MLLLRQPKHVEVKTEPKLVVFSSVAIFVICVSSKKAKI